MVSSAEVSFLEAFFPLTINSGAVTIKFISDKYCFQSWSAAADTRRALSIKCIKGLLNAIWGNLAQPERNNELKGIRYFCKRTS